MAVIECVDLSKSYGRHVTALNNISLSIDEGTSFEFAWSCISPLSLLYYTMLKQTIIHVFQR